MTARHDPEATEAAWLNCERWVELVYALAAQEEGD